MKTFQTKMLVLAVIVVGAVSAAVAQWAARRRTDPAQTDYASIRAAREDAAQVAREDRADTEDPRRQSVRPLLDCIEVLADHQLRAHWGYANVNARAIRRKIGDSNRFQQEPRDQGQPTKFESGEHHNTFVTTFGASNAVVWTLDGNRASAEGSSQPCPSDMTAANESTVRTVASRGSTDNDNARGAAGSASVRGVTRGSVAIIGAIVDSSKSSNSATSSSGSSKSDGSANSSMPANSSGKVVEDPRRNRTDESCEQCEQHQCGTEMQACDRLGGSKASLCHTVLSCFHSSHCAADFNDSDCYCGAGKQPSDCFAGTVRADGPCKALVEAGAESAQVSDIALRYSNVAFAGGAALAVLETCDYLKCTQCL